MDNINSYYRGTSFLYQHNELGREAGTVETLRGYYGIPDRVHDSSTFMSVAWKEDVKSKIFIDKIYGYFKTTYSMSVEETDDLLNQHKQYNTFSMIDGKGYARYNVEETTAYVMDCVVVRGSFNTIRKLCRIGKDKFPYLTTIRFERLLKKRKTMRHYKLKDFIKKAVL